VGHVIEKGSEAGLPYATVLLVETGEGTVTDAGGYFRFKKLPAGEYTLKVQIMKQGGRYGVRLKASAPSLHIIRADIETTVSPIVGNEKQSEDMVNYLLQEFEGDTTKIWQSNIFGRSFHEIVNEDLQAKLKHMPDDARLKLRQTLERIINEGTGGLICIIL
jgi:stage IV sporulation protein A